MMDHCSIRDFKQLSRRAFFGIAAAAAATKFLPWTSLAADATTGLPMGAAPAPLDAAWFPGRMHAFIWRNWALVTIDRMAAVLGAKPDDIVRVGKATAAGVGLGLGG